ncbi:hypothetical protein ACMBCN_01585, partial [Candidatus Liberibacter asiaticus]|nr:hypothetical protein [Candidatus Liberibacter asiaticus]
ILYSFRNFKVNLHNDIHFHFHFHGQNILLIINNMQGEQLLRMYSLNCTLYIKNSINFLYSHILMYF